MNPPSPPRSPYLASLVGRARTSFFPGAAFFYFHCMVIRLQPCQVKPNVKYSNQLLRKVCRYSRWLGLRLSNKDFYCRRKACWFSRPARGKRGSACGVSELKRRRKEKKTPTARWYNTIIDRPITCLRGEGGGLKAGDGRLNQLCRGEYSSTCCYCCIFPK